jgi:hypothetical protein
MLQEYDTQRDERTWDNYNNTELKSIDASQTKTPFYTEQKVRGRQPYEPPGEKLSYVRKYEPSIFVRTHENIQPSIAPLRPRLASHRPRLCAGTTLLPVRSVA